MSKHGFATGPRHRRRGGRERPDWIIIVAAVLCGVSILGVCVSLAARPDLGSVGDPPLADKPPDWWSNTWPSANPALSGAASPAGPVPPGIAAPGSSGPGAPGPGGSPQGLTRTPGPVVGPVAGGTVAPNRPPRDPDPEPGTPLLTLAKTEGSVPVDLSAEGTRDWAHWGLRRPSSVTRKAGGPQAINDLGNNGPRERVETGTQRFSWRDGAPDGAVSDTPTGVSACGVGTAFKLSVPAGPQTRTLRLHGGVWRATGRFDVSLSGTNLSRSAEVSREGVLSLPVVYTVKFRAPAGGQLTIRWGVTAIFQQSCGSVDLRAATLQ
ncbi:MAG TPA: hypothetical protein VF755_12090 [Catenuloplanes sp.]